MQILLTIPDDYQPENSDNPEENNPFSMVQAALEHFEIPSVMTQFFCNQELAPNKMLQARYMLDLLRRQYKAGVILSALPYNCTGREHLVALENRDKVHAEIGELLKEIDGIS